MKTIQKTIGRLEKDELAKNGFIMFISGTVVGILNYMYQIYMGRALGPEEYGVFGALFAIFYMIGIISQTLGTSTTQFISRFAREETDIGLFIKGCLKRTILFGSAISILLFLFNRDFMNLLKLPSIWPIMILILILSLSWINPIIDGSLRGLKRFSALSFVNISNTSFKLIFGITLVMAGFGVSGALSGVAIGTIIGLIISFIFLKPFLKTHNPDEHEFRFSSFYSYSLPVMVAMICISIPSNLDLVLAKFFFSPLEAGLYTSVSVMGKMIFFFSGAVSAVMFPLITEKYNKREDTRVILKKSLFYAGVLSGFLLSIYVLFPQIVIGIFGNNYINAVDFVAPYGAAMFFVSIISIIMNYHLAIKNIRFVALFAGFTIFEVALLVSFNTSIAQMINVLFIANFVFLIISMTYTFLRTDDTACSNIRPVTG